MQTTLVTIQMVLSVILMLSILLQNKGAGLSETFGGGEASGVQITRRGPEKVLYYATILLALAFFGISIAIMILA